MTQNGVVIAVLPSGNARVAVRSAAACSGNCACCGECSCSEQTVTAENRCCADAGDRVTLRSCSRISFSAVIIYLLPLAAFFIGYGISMAFGAKDGVTVLVSILCLLLGCGVVTRLGKRRNKNISYEIISIER